jgi:hypothetical protein
VIELTDDLVPQNDVHSHVRNLAHCRVGGRATSAGR